MKNTIILLFAWSFVSPLSALAGSGGAVNIVNETMRTDSRLEFSVTSNIMDELEKKRLKNFTALPATFDPDTGARVKLFKDKDTGEYKIVIESAE